MADVVGPVSALLGAVVGGTAALAASRQQVKAAARERLDDRRRDVYLTFAAVANRVTVTWYHRCRGEPELARHIAVTGSELEGALAAVELFGDAEVCGFAARFAQAARDAVVQYGSLWANQADDESSRRTPPKSVVDELGALARDYTNAVRRAVGLAQDASGHNTHWPS
jgi:hypothetical protein